MPTETGGETPEKAEKFKTPETIWKESEPLITDINSKLREKLEAISEKERKRIRTMKINDKEYSVFGVEKYLNNQDHLELWHANPKTGYREEMHRFFNLQKESTEELPDTKGYYSEYHETPDGKQEIDASILKSHEPIIRNPKIAQKFLENLKDAFEKGTAEFIQEKK